MEQLGLGVGARLGATQQPLPLLGSPEVSPADVSLHRRLVDQCGLPDHVEGDARHADHQPHRIDGGDVSLLDGDGQTQTEDLLHNPGHAEGEAGGVGDQ